MCCLCVLYTNGCVACHFLCGAVSVNCFCWCLCVFACYTKMCVVRGVDCAVLRFVLLLFAFVVCV